MNTFGVGIIGFGRIDEEYEQWMRHARGVEVVAVADSTPARRDESHPMIRKHRIWSANPKIPTDYQPIIRRSHVVLPALTYAVVVMPGWMVRLEGGFKLASTR